MAKSNLVVVHKILVGLEVKKITMGNGLFIATTLLLLLEALVLHKPIHLLRVEHVLVRVSSIG
jgi:hypothetical protein